MVLPRPHRVSTPRREKNMKESTSNMPTWLITGCSSGLGRHLAQAVLERGWNAVVTARNPSTVRDIAALFARAPITQCPGVVSTTTVGPALHLPFPSSESVSVGNVIVGPTPQSSLPEFAGEKKRLGLMSPRPNALGIPAAGEGWFMMGYNG